MLHSVSLQHLPQLTKSNLRWNTSKNLEVMPEQAPSSPRETGYACTCNNPKGLQLKASNKQTKTPQQLGSQPFSKRLLQKLDFCLHQTCQEGMTTPSWPVGAIIHRTQLLPELDPRCQKSLPENTEKFQWETTGKWKWTRGKHSTRFLEGRHGRRNRETVLSPLGSSGVSWTPCRRDHCWAQTRTTEVRNWGGGSASFCELGHQLSENILL